MFHLAANCTFFATWGHNSLLFVTTGVRLCSLPYNGDHSVLGNDDNDEPDFNVQLILCLPTPLG